MARRRRRKQSGSIQRKNGTVYLLQLQLGDDKVYKIGCTANTVGKRAMQVIESIEKTYGYYPRVEVLQEWKCANYYQVENSIHKAMEEYRYVTAEEFSGHTEIYSCEYGIILDKYKEGIANSDKFTGADNTFDL